MQETKASHVEDEKDREKSRDDNHDMNPGDSRGDDVKKHVDCKNEDGSRTGSGTGSQDSEPSIKGQETEPVEGLDHECDITTSKVSEVAQESGRGFSGFDLNEEFCSEETPECSLAGTHKDSKQQSSCLDIDLNVADENEDKGVFLPGLSSSSSSSERSFSTKHFDLNFDLKSNAASLDKQKGVFSLFGTQVEVNHMDMGPHPSGRILEPTSRAGWVHDSFAPLDAPIQYMVDPRGMRIAPQFAPPFVMNMAGGPCFGPTGAGVQQNTGLNLGLMMYGGSSSSVAGGKRHEPDGGWEAYAVNYKHHPSPWK